jgi:hypothetical protein
VKPHSGQVYFAAIFLQSLHLTISDLLQLGHEKMVVPWSFATFFLHDEHRTLAMRKQDFAGCLKTLCFPYFK